MVFAVDTEGFEERLHIDGQGELVVLFENVLYQLLTLTGTPGVEFQQTVAAVVHFTFEALALSFGFVHQGVPGIVVAAFEHR
ncbi:hypothetical protein D3C80_2044060 [compost metagenome]